MPLLDRRDVLAGGAALAGAAVLSAAGSRPASANAPFVQPKLPYAEDALAPVISARTVQLHYGKHHAGYFKKLNELVEGTPYADMLLERVVVESRAKDPKIFGQAGQAWNHVLYWNQFAPGGAAEPGGRLKEAIDRDLGGLDSLKGELTAASVAVFGTGWGWLFEKDGKLQIAGFEDADNPLAHGGKALLGIDVWEHAYYLDYENRREEHVKAVLDRLVNWDVVAERLAEA